MEVIEKRRQAVLQTLDTLQEALILIENPAHIDLFKSLRDSLIQRFEYTIDTFWKFLKIYLQEKDEADLPSAAPRAILREAFNGGLLQQKELDLLIESIADRNLTSHSYNEVLAQELLDRIPLYYEVMRHVVERIIV
jgi:nucleotidyltransferase substrate binding protein (TIGR01987 family)